MESYLNPLVGRSTSVGRRRSGGDVHSQARRFLGVYVDLHVHPSCLPCCSLLSEVEIKRRFEVSIGSDVKLGVLARRY